MTDTPRTISPASIAPATDGLASGRVRVLDVRSLLAWTNARIVVVKQLRGHRHDDDAWWEERQTTAREVQRERETLRQVANLLHVERATKRGKLHGFATLDEQYKWLARWEKHTCWRAADYLHVARDSTLIALREGRVTHELARAESPVEQVPS
ncbi:MAG: hypothetical protein ACKV2T_34825 [Kofleriaceae bacterium]